MNITKNKTKYIEDLNVYCWVKNEPKACFKLKKCLYLKHHGKDMSNSIYSEITTCIREALDDMLNDEFDFMKTQSIYTPFEDEVGKIGYSTLKAQADVHAKGGSALMHLTSLGCDLFMAMMHNSYESNYPSYYIGRGMTRPIMYPDPMFIWDIWYNEELIISPDGLVMARSNFFQEEDSRYIRR